MTELLHKELTGNIIGVYYDVYNGTGRQYPEFIYERAMMGDLQIGGIQCLRQPEYKVTYKDKIVGVQQLDLFVAGEVVVEIKVVPKLSPLHKAQANSYLKTVGKEVSLLLNFGGAKPEFQRIYFQNRPVEGSDQENTPSSSESFPSGLLHPELTGEVIGSLYQVHSILGPGFIHRIYANAVYHELVLRGLDVLSLQEYQVIYRGRPIGEIKFNHIQVESDLMVFPVAIQDINNLSINNLKDWMKAQNISLGILANFHPTSLDFTLLRM